MKSLLKYLVIILMTVIFTVVLLNQFAPILIKVPNKDTQEIKINFDEMPIRKNFNQPEKTAKNIILMIGDNLGDFVDGSDNKASAEIRLKAAEKYSEMWGTHWFMLANPTYGDWENTIIDFKYEIPRSEQLKIKLETLDSK